MTNRSRVDVYSSEANVLGEGPIWSSVEEALYWLDIGRKMLFRRAPTDTKCRSWSLPDYPGCLAELASGSIGVAMGEGLHRLDVESGDTELMSSASPRYPGTRFNDGKTDPLGRLWVGTMQNNFGPSDEQIAIDRTDGVLYRFDSDGNAHVVEERIGIPNTLAWSPNLKRFYFADSLCGEMYVYDFDVDSGVVRNKRPFFESTSHGIPDGSAMDVDGCLWNARWGGNALLRITPDGEIDRVVALPVPNPTSCAFGGPNRGTLYVTSAVLGLSAAERATFPLSGSVFAITGLAQGMAVPPLAIKSRTSAPPAHANDMA